MGATFFRFFFSISFSYKNLALIPSAGLTAHFENPEANFQAGLPSVSGGIGIKASIPQIFIHLF